MNAPKFKLRPPQPQDAEAMSDLAMRSKAYWGYDEEFMEACRAELTITPERLTSQSFIVAEEDGQLVGMAGLSREGTEGEVEDVFVDPARIGQGLGGQLMAWIFGESRRLNLETLYVDADPNALDFYKAQGFQEHSWSPSGSIPGRTLPRLKLSLPTQQP